MISSQGVCWSPNETNRLETYLSVIMLPSAWGKILGRRVLLMMMVCLCPGGLYWEQH
jgi:hypothetical protein